MRRWTLATMLLLGCGSALRSQDDAPRAHLVDADTRNDAAHRAEEELTRRRALQAQAEQRAREQADTRRAEAVQRWLTQAPVDCHVQLSTRPCDFLPDGASDDDAAQCRAVCTARISARLATVYAHAVDVCVADRDTRCHLALPGGSTESLDDRAADCVRECAAGIKAAGIASPPARTTGARVKCCDGVTSPTCACPGHQGCCSHHRGVCGCTD